MCTVCTSNVPQIRRFRSYKSANNLEHECTIWEAARATSAAPTYYPPVEIGPPGRRERFIDGGMGCNNPIFELHVEAEDLFESSREVACIISLGTGKRKTNQLPEPSFFDMMLTPNNIKGAIDIAQSFKRIALDSDSRANDMDRKYSDVDGVYFRFTVEQGLQNIKLAEPQKLSDVRTQTLAYIELPKVSAALDRAAAALVRQDAKKREYRLGHLCKSLNLETCRNISCSRTCSDQKPCPTKLLLKPPPSGRLFSRHFKTIEPPICVGSPRPLHQSTRFMTTMKICRGDLLIAKPDIPPVSGYLKRKSSKILVAVSPLASSAYKATQALGSLFWHRQLLNTCPPRLPETVTIPHCIISAIRNHNTRRSKTLFADF